MRSVRKLWFSNWRGQTYSELIIEGARPTFWPLFTNKTSNYWRGQGPLGPPITTSLNEIELDTFHHDPEDKPDLIRGIHLTQAEDVDVRCGRATSIVLQKFC